MSEKESPDKRKRSEHSSVSEPDIGKEDTKTQNSKERQQKKKTSKPAKEPIPDRDESLSNLEKTRLRQNEESLRTLKAENELLLNGIIFIEEKTKSCINNQMD